MLIILDLLQKNIIIISMIKSVFGKLSLVLYYVLGALILEFITFKMLNLGVAPQYFMLNLSIILAIALIIYCVPNFTAQYVIYSILLFVQTVFIYVNYSLINIYGDLFSFDMMGLVKEATAAMTSSFVFYDTILQLVTIYLSIFLCGFIVLHYCKKSKIKLKQHYSIFNIILLIGIQFLSCGYYVYERNFINELSNLDAIDYVESDTFLMNTNFLKENNYSKFGTFGYWLNLFVNGATINNSAQNKAAINYFNNGNIYDSSEVFGVDSKGQKNNVIVIMMESLEWFPFSNGEFYSIDEETQEKVYDRQKILDNLSYEFTPNFYSLIYGDDYLIDTNNSNKTNDALISSNFFAKSKTNISEGQGIIGNYPVGDTLTNLIGKDKNAYNYALPHILKNNGYTTSYVHSNVISYYERGTTHQYLGFDNVIGRDGIMDEDGNPAYTKDEMHWDDWDAEGDFARKAINYIIPKDYNSKPFFTFDLNVSSHGAYTPEHNQNDGDALRYLDYVKYGRKNCILVDKDGHQFLKDTTLDENELLTDENIIKDIETLQQYYPDAFYCWKLPFKTEEEFEIWDKNTPDEEKYSTYYYNINKNIEDEALKERLAYYECGVIGLDDAIGVIIDNLKQKGIYNNTTMLLYSDHYCYYNKESHLVKGFDIKDYSSIELNTIPMVISSPGLKQLMVDKKDELANLGYDFTLNERFCSAYDVAPTILDLLGIKFNENFYMGHSLFRPADYTYELNGITKDLVVYYSVTGGLFSQDTYTFNLVDFYSPTGKKLEEDVPVNYYSSNGELVSDATLTSLFKSEATNILVKLNYLHILNKYHLYGDLTNI